MYIGAKGDQMELIKLGLIKVDFGIKGDPDRVKKIVGDFPSYIDLTNDRFPQLAEWPTGQIEVELAIAWFPGEYFPNFSAVDDRLSQEKSIIGRTQIPHFIAGIIQRINELWERYQKNEGPRWIYTSDNNSFWRDGDGGLCLPYVLLYPYYRKPAARWFGFDFVGGYGFLVACE